MQILKLAKLFGGVDIDDFLKTNYTKNIDEIINLKDNKSISLNEYKKIQGNIIDVSNQKSKTEVSNIIKNSQTEYTIGEVINMQNNRNVSDEQYREIQSSFININKTSNRRNANKPPINKNRQNIYNRTKSRRNTKVSLINKKQQNRNVIANDRRYIKKMLINKKQQDIRIKYDLKNMQDDDNVFLKDYKKLQSENFDVSDQKTKEDVTKIVSGEQKNIGYENFSVKNPGGMISKFVGFFTGTGSAVKNSYKYNMAIFSKKYGKYSEDLINLQDDNSISFKKYKDMQNRIVDTSKQKNKKEVQKLIRNTQEQANYKPSTYKTHYERRFGEIKNKWQSGKPEDKDNYLKEQEQLVSNSVVKSDKYKQLDKDSKMIYIEQYITNKRKKEKLNIGKFEQYKDYYIGGTKSENAQHIIGQGAKTATGIQAVTSPFVLSSKLYEGQQRDRQQRQERKENIMSLTSFSTYRPQSYRQRIINIMNQGMR